MRKIWTISQLRCCLIWLMVYMVLVSCTPQVVTKQDVANQQSKLPAILMRESDFTGDWHWVDKRITQKPETPTEDNDRLIESASSGYAGDYGAERYYISIWHVLARYEQQPRMFAYNDILLDENAGGQHVLNLDFVPMGQAESSLCVKTDAGSGIGVITCIVAVNYDRLRSSIMVYAPGNISLDDLQKIINGLLSNIDNRIQALER